MLGRSSSRTSAAILALAAGALACGEGAGASRDVTVGAASSLRVVLPEAVRRFEAGSPGPRITLTFGGSGALRKQVEAGAPVDAVILAGAAPVDGLIEARLAREETRRIVARNELVLIVPRGGPELTFATLLDLPDDERIAIGDPASVPVGRYAREALETLGVWETLVPRLVYAPHVAAVLAFARRGEVAAAIVYRTDVRGIDDVVVRDAARPPWGPTPQVVAAVTRAAAHADRAEALLDYLGSEEGRALLSLYGFVPEAQ